MAERVCLDIYKQSQSIYIRNTYKIQLVTKHVLTILLSFHFTQSLTPLPQSATLKSTDKTSGLQLSYYDICTVVLAKYYKVRNRGDPTGAIKNKGVVSGGEDMTGRKWNFKFHGLKSKTHHFLKLVFLDVGN